MKFVHIQLIAQTCKPIISMATCKAPFMTPKNFLHVPCRILRPVTRKFRHLIRLQNSTKKKEACEFRVDTLTFTASPGVTTNKRRIHKSIRSKCSQQKQPNSSLNGFQTRRKTERQISQALWISLTSSHISSATYFSPAK